MRNQDKRKLPRKIMPEPRIMINGKIAGYLEDISLIGAGLVCNEHYEKGDILRFTIDFGRWIFFRSITFKQVRVVYHAPQHYYDMVKLGVEFVDAEKAEMQKLHDFISFWEQDEQKLKNYISNLDKMIQDPEKMDSDELQKILAQFTFLRIIPLSHKFDELVKNMNISRKLVQTLEKLTDMGAEELIHLEDTIKAFERAQDMFKSEIMAKEEVLEAYEKLQNFMRVELLEKEKVLEATERVLDLAIEEKRDRDETIRTLERVEELMRHEQIEKDQIIQAHEDLQELYRREMLEKENLLNAFHKLEKAHSNELKEKNELLKMHEILEDLARKEIIEKDKEINIREVLTELSRQEILERDEVLKTYHQFSEIIQNEIEAKDLLISRLQNVRKDFKDAHE